ncbi:replication protein A 70 kDa DNA-binding subunit [Onthophagus taurus]|uniref:replication protein A 70 kDa DNA-binding subunit n=1 Tax=Onthophagus taurus TaxID=166361 RepID=UPI000C2064D1|nr:replication protein A 70 kDa DNA-binding subunit [Onthophagus taurus]
MDVPKLTEGSLKVIMQGGQIDKPVMQVLGCKLLPSGNSSSKERYRLLLSDGVNYITFAMLTTQVHSGELSSFSIIRINKYVSTVINNTGKSEKKLLVLLDIDVLVDGSKLEKIGEPLQLPDSLEQIESSNHSNNNVSNVSKPVVSGSSSVAPKKNGIDLNSTSLQDCLHNPIASISPYQNKWVIKARVSNKSAIRTWSNSRGEGKLFSMDLIDESGEIRATAFRDLVDKFYDMIEVDKVYYISKCLAKMANKQYTSIKNDYELTLTNDTIIQPCEDDIDEIPQTQFNFISIDKISNIVTGSMVDVIGVCKSATDVQTFNAKSTGRELKKREVTLVDTTNTGVSLTLWGADAEKFEDTSNPIVALKGVKVGEFGGGKNISLIGGSIMRVNPDIPEAHKLRGWFDNDGMGLEVNNISARTGGGNFQTEWMNLRAVKEAGLGRSERGDYYQVKATVILLRSDKMLYKACANEGCNKKVVDLENGMFRCEKCAREYPGFKYRLLGSANISDWSGNQWISMFSSEVEKIIGATAEEAGNAVQMDMNALAEIGNKANFKQFVFKCRAKYESYNDETRLKTVAVRVDTINYKEYNNHLITRIKQLMSE